VPIADCRFLIDRKLWTMSARLLAEEPALVITESSADIAS
jgi:hypothetical protein